MKGPWHSIMYKKVSKCRMLNDFFFFFFNLKKKNMSGSCILSRTLKALKILNQQKSNPIETLNSFNVFGVVDQPIDFFSNGKFIASLFVLKCSQYIVQLKVNLKLSPQTNYVVIYKTIHLYHLNKLIIYKKSHVTKTTHAWSIN